MVLGTAKSARIAREAKSERAQDWAKDYLEDLTELEKKAKRDGVGFTLKYIADNFNEMGLRTRTGKAWSTRSVQLLKKQREAISLKSI